jgi:hypothetical protein
MQDFQEAAVHAAAYAPPVYLDLGGFKFNKNSMS